MRPPLAGALCASVWIIVAVLILCPQSGALKGNQYPAGCLRQYDVNIGYYARTLSRPAVLRIAPDPDAKAIRRLEADRRFGLQSLPNPNFSSDPGTPPSTNGYVWGYSKKGGQSGWLPEDALALDSDVWADGPGHEDFQAPEQAPHPKARPGFTLGRRLKGRTTVMEGTVYLRWAPGSSAKAIVTEGTVVRMLWSASGSICVETAQGRGWMHSDMLSVSY